MTIGTLTEPAEKLAAKIAVSACGDEFLKGSALLLQKQTKKMLSDAKKDLVTFDAKDVIATKKDLVTLIGTVLHACMHRCSFLVEAVTTAKLRR